MLYEKIDKNYNCRNFRMHKKNDRSCLSDSIPTFILKPCANLLSPVLAYMVNKSFDESNVPSDLKHAIVTPIIKDKNGNQDKYQNYRPVSNLPFFGKYCTSPNSRTSLA